MLQAIIENASLNPRRLFLIDGFGAMLSAFLLGIVLVKYENVFGIPWKTLYFLASLPCLFAVYDFSCYLKINNDYVPYLKVIAYTNLVYCCFSLGLAFYHQTQLTWIGWAYITIEILIVTTLAYIEIKVAGNKS